RQAKVYTSKAARTVLEIAMQCHGDVAMTWEHPLHLRLRRALVARQLLGDGREHERAIATQRLTRATLLTSQPGSSGRTDIAIGDSPDEAAVRSRLQTWLAENPVPETGDGPDAAMQSQFAWHRELADAGLVGLSFPSAFGGRGLTPLYDAIL